MAFARRGAVRGSRRHCQCQRYLIGLAIGCLAISYFLFLSSPRREDGTPIGLLLACLLCLVVVLKNIAGLLPDNWATRMLRSGWRVTVPTTLTLVAFDFAGVFHRAALKALDAR